jgi:coenzyme F420 hydrogenase subunit beta
MVLRTGRRSSQDLLKKRVLETGLCTGCGACVGLCPYQVIYSDRTVQLHRCDLEDGKCQAFCPRAEIDLGSLRSRLFDAADLTPEIGAVQGYYFSRAADPRLRAITQHGGTVTVLMELALAENLINSAIVSSGRRDLEQSCVIIKDKAALRTKAGSKFLVSPTVAAFNQKDAESAGNIGVVVTPCQALALAKMKLKPRKDDADGIDKLKIVIGLYCGWTLSAGKFKVLLLQNNIDPAEITGMDIPGGQKALALKTAGGEKMISFDHVDPCIREACRYCIDSTAEFADISVGSARFGAAWEEMRGWNQMLVRTARGRQLVDLAVNRGVLEIRPAPVEALQELKKAAAAKKRTALKNIIRKSGSAKNLLYLRSSDPFVKKFLAKNKR